ncbi:non-ribosomal peptide synthetase [Amycolatopsis sp. TNS106]|uniref:non-ribosomal peptide synthetase n=1 Tax=Amycolatopsis sp. TNS106 TaxID=2861750 RepID=UPI001C56BFD7|nr:non-ribosomal peptide synthetase [Amycolatopsis sp. TNS106]QXV56954.1 hypothetical protein CVV72_07985 [Amycolatopsis sp. TNS106]
MADVEDLYPLTLPQQGMLFHTLSATDQEIYREQVVWSLSGRVDSPLLAEAWQQVVEANTVLRTSFVWEVTETPLQAVHRTVVADLHQHDWSRIPTAQRADRLQEFVDSIPALDLEYAPLVRLDLIQLGPAENWLVWTCHHGILDGWSVGELRRELIGVHNDLCAGKKPTSSSRPPFRDHVAWLKNQDMTAGREFWRERMRGFATPLRLPDGFEPDPAGGHSSVQIALSSNETQILQELCRSERLTPSTLVQGAWAVLLHRYTGADDVVFGVTSAGRPLGLPRVEVMVGPFVTTTPLRTTVAAEQVDDWLHHLQRDQLEAMEHEHVALLDIHAYTDVPRGVPLFETVLAFENHLTDATAEETVGAISVGTVLSSGVTNYPLTVVITAGRQLRFRITYDRSRFDRPWMLRLASHLRTILTGMVGDLRQLTSELVMLSAEELAQQETWNATTIERTDQRLDDLFLRQAATTPQAVAVIDAERTLTYADLERHSAALANQLADHGAARDQLVGVILDRGWRQVVAVVAVLRAGGAYLPIDPRWPAARRADLLDRGGCKVAIVEPGGRDLGDIQALTVPADPAETRSSASIDTGAPSDLAYVIFTSGSTGVPKGVAIEHRAAANTILDINERHQVNTGDRVLNLSALTFDLSVYDIFGALAAGAAVVLPEPSAAREPARWSEWITDHGVTIWNSVPAVLDVLVDHAQNAAPDFSSVRLALLSGDWIPVSLPGRFRKLAPDAAVVSLGGATEASIWSISYPIDQVDTTWDSIPYGTPLDNQRFRILNAALEPVPAGVPGELCIAGRGLAREYWRDGDRTRAAFVSCPLTGERIYRTGDLGRYDREGVIRFLGRLDGQVKIHGFRIEPGEVEAALLEHPSVAAVTVIARGQTDKRLVAYVVTPTAVSGKKLRDHLTERLPQYLIPAVFVPLEELPLSANGKVDRSALPALTRPSSPAAMRATPPRTELEARLASVWASTLGVDEVGLEDNFFELGGDSLTSMRLASALHRDGIDVPIGTIFDKPTVGELSDYLERKLPADGLPPVPHIDRAEPVALTFAQEMIQILNAMTPGNTQYVPRMSLSFHGSLDLSALRQALSALTTRHPALRSTFEQGANGQIVQRVLDEVATPVVEYDLTGLPADAAMSEVARILGDDVVATFDPLADRPLHRAALVKITDEHFVLHLGLDHMVCDGWSMMLLHRDLLELYRGAVIGLPAELPPLSVDYLDFAAWQRVHLSGDRLQATADYWRRRMAGAPPMQLPSSKPPVPLNEMRGRVHPVAFEAEILDAATGLARRERTTVFAVLMAAVQAMVWARVREDVITVSAPVGGRTRPELENVVGCFVHGMMFPTSLVGSPSFAEVVGRVRDGMREAWDHQTLPLTEMASISEFATVNNMGTQGIALEWVDDQTGTVRLPGLAGPVDVAPWWPDRSGEVDMPPADLFIYLHRRPSDGSLAGEFMYNAARFDVPEIEAVYRHLRAILARGTHRPETPLAELAELE